MSLHTLPLDADAIEAHLPSLIRLLEDAVGDGASIGFLPPLHAAEAIAYWRDVQADVGAGRRVLLAALDAGTLCGSVQLALETRANGLHRAEVQKLMVHGGARRRGIGGALMHAAECTARVHGRTLLVLDTRAGDDAEHLYRRLQWQECGRIPDWAADAHGQLHATVLFHKPLRR